MSSARIEDLDPETVAALFSDDEPQPVRVAPLDQYQTNAVLGIDQPFDQKQE